MFLDKKNIKKKIVKKRREMKIACQIKINCKLLEIGICDFFFSLNKESEKCFWEFNGECKNPLCLLYILEDFQKQINFNI